MLLRRAKRFFVLTSRFFLLHPCSSHLSHTFPFIYLTPLHGAPNGATVSSYQLLEDGTVQLIDGAVAAGQTAACWLATTPTGRIAFTADTPANAISAFSIDAAGHLSLLHTRAAEENRPTDLAVSTDGRMLYALSGGDHSVGVYRILKGGALQKLRTLDGLPAGVTGLVVR